METTYFVLGMLSIIAVAFVAVIVVGLLKINKQQKTINELIDRIKGLHLDQSQQFDSVYRNIDQTTNDIHRSIHDNLQDLDRRLGSMDAHANRVLEDVSKDCRSYTDSRIDKLIDTYFEMIGSKKQVIKG